jgi:bifunctional non-homologous end joining protein LigD
VQQTANATKELENGKLHFTLHGAKLKGDWYLVRLRDEDQWLIIKAGEDHKKLGKAREEKSAASGKTLAQIAKGKRVWNSKRSGGDSHGAMKSPTPPSKRKVTLSRPKPVAKKRASGKKAKFIVPMMARLLAEPPPGDWQYEIKFDGFRALAYKDGDAVEVLSRNNKDLAGKFTEVAEAIPSLRAAEAIVDGEIVALDKDGRSSFQLLQAYALGQEKPPLCYYVFDLLSLDGESMRELPLEERRKKLEAILPKKQDVIRYSSSLGSDAPALLKKAARLGLEGLIGKRAGSLYEAGKRTGTWIKLKLVKEQEFVIGGYTDPGGSRKHFGALLVGVYEKGQLAFAGKVGTGFNAALLRELFHRFKPLETDKCPFPELPEGRQGRYGQRITAAEMKRCHWLKPSLVCQLKFTEWTDDGRLRHPAFMGMRDDKKPKDVIREPVQNPS